MNPDFCEYARLCGGTGFSVRTARRAAPRPRGGAGPHRRAVPGRDPLLVEGRVAMAYVERQRGGRHLVEAETGHRRVLRLAGGLPAGRHPRRSGPAGDAEGHRRRRHAQRRRRVRRRRHLPPPGRPDRRRHGGRRQGRLPAAPLGLRPADGHLAVQPGRHAFRPTGPGSPTGPSRSTPTASPGARAGPTCTSGNGPGGERSTGACTSSTTSPTACDPFVEAMSTERFEPGNDGGRRYASLDDVVFKPGPAGPPAAARRRAGRHVGGARAPGRPGRCGSPSPCSSAT